LGQQLAQHIHIGCQLTRVSAVSAGAFAWAADLSVHQQRWRTPGDWPDARGFHNSLAVPVDLNSIDAAVYIVLLAAFYA
jgi:hypothetical protein